MKWRLFQSLGTFAVAIFFVKFICAVEKMQVILSVRDSWSTKKIIAGIVREIEEESAGKCDFAEFCRKVRKKCGPHPGGR